MKSASHGWMEGLSPEAHMENVPSKPNTAGVNFWLRYNFGQKMRVFFVANGNILSGTLYQALRGKIILGLVTWVTQAM